MNVLQDSLLELVRRTSAEIPDDVHKAILDSLEREKQGTIAASAMKIFEQTAREAVKLATKKGFLRQNSVDSITGKNDGTNVGPGAPAIHFHQHASPEVSVRLILKGGGCENVGAQYSLPNEK